MSALSSQQFTPVTPKVEAPLSLGSSTTGSTTQRTAWVTRHMGGNTPLAYSARTRGTTFNWGDDNSTTAIPKSDSGASFGRGE